MTAGEDVCQVSSIPDDINAAAIEDNEEAVANRTANVTVTKDEQTTNYELNISEGEMSENEKRNMSESMKAACGNKAIEQITVRSTSKDEFEKLANGELLSIPIITIQRNRQLFTGCSRFKVEQTILGYLRFTYIFLESV